MNSLLLVPIAHYKGLIAKLTFTLIYACSLLIVYKLVVYPNFAYMGYRIVSLDVTFFLINLIVLLLVTSQVPNSITKPSDLFVWFFFVIVLIPSLMIPLMTVSNIDKATLLTSQMSFVTGFLLIIWISNYHVDVMDLPYLSQRLFLITLLFFFLIIFLFLLKDYGFNPMRLFSLESLASLYDIRFEQRAAQASASLISLYGVSWLTKIIIPMLLILSLYYKKHFFAFCFIAAQLVVFTMSAHKSYVITLFITIYMYNLMTKQDNAGIIFFRMVTLGVLASLIIFFVFNNTILIDVLVRRALVVPGMLSGYFIEYFGENGLAYYSQNFMKVVLETKYSAPPAFIIGEEYFGRSELRANVNALGDSYGNLGNIGVVFNSILMGMILLVLNIFSSGKEPRIIIPSLCGIAWTFSESSFVTSLITHGAVFAVLLILLFPKIKKTSKS